MKVIVNFPDTLEGINEFEERIAHFHATLLLENIKALKVDNNMKKDLLNKLLKYIKSSDE